MNLNRITAEKLPDHFNCSNDDKSIEDRSGKKGTEPESVTTGTIDGRTYAFIALERIGGIMVYDVTSPAEAFYVNYVNTRDFSEDIAGDVAPEGLCFIPAQDSPTKAPMLLVANEVSGTVATYDLRCSMLITATWTPRSRRSRRTLTATRRRASPRWKRPRTLLCATW